MSERNDSVTKHALFDNHIVQDVLDITRSWQSLKVWKEKYDGVRQMWYKISVGWLERCKNSCTGPIQQGSLESKRL